MNLTKNLLEDSISDSTQDTTLAHQNTSLTQDTVRVAIIGAGGIAYKFHLPELTRIPGVTVTHLAGRKETRLKTLCERFSVPHWTTDPHTLFTNPDIDAIVVATPHPLHVSFGIEALRAGKHLLMQKPLCADMSEADRFLAGVEKTEKTVMCLPHLGAEIYAIKREAEAGHIGKISAAHCRVSHGGPEVYYAEILDAFGEGEGENSGEALWFFKSGEAAVGALFDMGVYAASVLVSTMGRVKSVMGMVSTHDKPTELEDTATLLLEFASGAIGTLETGWCDPAKTYCLRLHGTTGKLCAPGEAGASATRWEPGSYTREDTPSLPHPLDSMSDSRGSAHEHWIRCIRERRQPELSNARLAHHVTQVLLAGLESANTGRRIELSSSYLTGFVENDTK